MNKWKALSALALFACLVLLDPKGAAAQQLGPRQPDMTIDAAARKEVVENLIKRLNDAYVFPDTAAKMEQAIRGRAARGEYEQITSAEQFAEKLTADLREVSHDKHLGVHYSARPLPQDLEPKEPTAEQREQMRQMGEHINYAFEKLGRMPGNIGYISFNGFFPPDAGAAETVASVFNFVAHTDALIIDLRQNGGGEPKMVALVCSYLFGPEPVHLNDLHWREGKGERVEEFWTLKDVAGKRYTKDVYVLTSSRTFSGAEEFANNLKVLKRATIVGETTGGGANPGGGNRLSEHFFAFIPTGRAVNPYTKTNWEGTGVEPDVKTSADAALQTAQVIALKKMAAQTTDEGTRADIQRRIEALQKEIDAAQVKK
jgi:retinol-binding protein 3